MNLLSKKTLCASAAVMALLGAGASTAQAQVHYFSQNNLLYSFDQSNPSGTLTTTPKTITGLGSGALDLRVSGLAFDPSGTLWAGNAAGKFFTVDTTTGAATFKFNGTNLNTIATFDFRQNGSTLEILANQTASGGNSTLRRYNASTGVEIGGGVSLNLGNASTNYAGDPASGYDASTGKYYIVKGGAATTASEDFSLRSYDVSAGTFSASLPTNLTWASAGGAWFGNQLYLGYRPGVDGTGGNWYLPSDATNDDIYFGTLNTATGAFTQISGAKFDISIAGAMNPGTTGPSFGYAIAPVPEPETYAMFLAGLVMAVFMARRSQKDAV